MESKKLEDWPIKIIDGDRSSRYPKANEMVNEGVLFLSTPSIVDGTIDASVSNFVTQEKFASISKGRLEHSDIVMTTRGTIGKLAFFKSSGKYPTGLINAQMLILRPDPEVIRPKYLFYLMGSEKYQTQIKSFSSGSAQPQIPITDLKKTVLNFPTIETQDAIVEVIDKYSNLIENNNRRIAVLEDMAQSLYREWFVNFRYPNHKDNIDAEGKPKLIESRLGKIPEGWQVKTAADVIAINPQTKLPKEGEKPFVGMSGLSETSMVISDITEKSGNSGAKFINNDTLFARITPCLQNGKTGFVQFLTPEKPVGFGSTEFIILRDSDYLSSEFIYLLSRSNGFREHAIQSMTGATGRQRVHNDCFASYYLAVPPKVLMNEFTKLVKPMFKSIFNLSQRNKNLKQQRDMILPKLISGQIELKD